MIKEIPNVKQYNSLDKLKSTINPTSIKNENDLIKQLNKRNSVYVYIYRSL